MPLITIPPPVPTSTPLSEETTQSGVSPPWLRWFQQMQAKIVNIAPGPYANDAAAQAAGVNVGQPYYLPTGVVVVRGAAKATSGRGAGVVYVGTSPATADADTTADQLLLSCTIPGGSLNVAGKVLRVTMGGYWTIQSGQTPNMGIFVNLENLQLFGVSESGLQSNNPNMTWRATWEAVVLTPGTSGQLVRHGQFLSRYTDAGGNEAMVPLIDVNYLSQGPIDLTHDQTLQSGCYFTTNTSPPNTLTLDVFIVEIPN